MPTSDTSRKRALECLRFEADCQELAARTDNPGLKDHFASMANVWADMAAKEPLTSGNGN
jgi:hypothetical protein